MKKNTDINNILASINYIIEKKRQYQMMLLRRLQSLLSSKRYETEMRKFRIAKRLKELRGVDSENLNKPSNANHIGELNLNDMGKLQEMLGGEGADFAREALELGEKNIDLSDLEGGFDFDKLNFQLPEKNRKKLEEKILKLIKEKGLNAALAEIMKDLNQYSDLPPLEELEKSIVITNDGDYNEASLRMMYERERAKLYQVYRLYQYLIDYDRWYKTVIQNILETVQQRYKNQSVSK